MKLINMIAAIAALCIAGCATVEQPASTPTIVGLDRDWVEVRVTSGGAYHDAQEAANFGCNVYEPKRAMSVYSTTEGDWTTHFFACI